MISYVLREGLFHFWSGSFQTNHGEIIYILSRFFHFRQILTIERERELNFSSILTWMNARGWGHLPKSSQHGPAALSNRLALLLQASSSCPHPQKLYPFNWMYLWYKKIWRCIYPIEFISWYFFIWICGHENGPSIKIVLRPLIPVHACRQGMDWSYDQP